MDSAAGHPRGGSEVHSLPTRKGGLWKRPQCHVHDHCGVRGSSLPVLPLDLRSRRVSIVAVLLLRLTAVGQRTCTPVGFSIITMYVAVVLLAGRLIRGLVTNGPLDVMISEIPNPDYLLKICLDIYLVREAHDFVLEQVQRDFRRGHSLPSGFRICSRSSSSCSAPQRRSLNGHDTRRNANNETRECHSSTVGLPQFWIISFLLCTAFIGLQSPIH